MSQIFPSTFGTCILLIIFFAFINYIFLTGIYKDIEKIEEKMFKQELKQIIINNRIFKLEHRN